MFRRIKQFVTVSVRQKRLVMWTGAFSAVLLMVVVKCVPQARLTEYVIMSRAAGRMAVAIDIIRKHCRESGIAMERQLDPNQTGLIGPARSPIRTSLGNLQAKRTATNPNIAGLLVHLLREAGVGRADSVAIGASGSFPGLAVAAVLAVQEIGAQPLVILSLGASSYGATREDFNLLDIYQLLRKKRVFSHPPLAISLGGQNDTGKEFESRVIKKLRAKIEAAGLTLLHETDLRKNSDRRLRLYFDHALQEKIEAFVNCGGNVANLGTHHLVLKLQPGLNTSAEIPEISGGVIFDMLTRDIPCVHLLNMRGLRQRYGLPWDPVPLPRAGSFGQMHVDSRLPVAFWFAILVMVIALCIFAFWYHRH